VAPSRGMLALVFFVLFIYPLANIPREGATARDEGLKYFLNIHRVLNNIHHAVIPLQPVAFGLLLALGIIAFLYAWRRNLRRVNIETIMVAGLLLVTIPWLAATFGVATITNRMKDVLPGTVAACVVLGAAVAQIVFVFPKRYLRAAAILTPLPLVVLVFVPQLQQDWTLVQERRMPDRRVALRQYVDINLEPGTIVVNGENHKTFNPFWGGLEARHWVDWWMSDNIMEYSVEEWRDERQMTYAAIPLLEWQEMQASQAGRDYLAQMLHLRDFTDPPDQRGPEVILYRFWRMEHEDAAPARFYRSPRPARARSDSLSFLAHGTRDRYSIWRRDSSGGVRSKPGTGRAGG
jgi:hypothetical protein